MTFLRKLITLSGCAKLKRKADNEVLDNEACLGLEAVEAVEAVTEASGLGGTAPGSPHPATYVPWRSPAVASRRLLDRVRDSPRVARRVLNTMTSPGRAGRGRGEAEEIFVVNMQRLGGDSGVGVVTWTQAGKVDSW